MATNVFRSEVLKSFKKLHQVRKNVFQGDDFALEAARKKINEEFKSKVNVVEPTAIQELIRFSQAVAEEMRTTIVQAKEIEPGRYKLRITNDTAKLDNVPFKDCPS